jgi:hypothetical protein
MSGNSGGYHVRKSQSEGYLADDDVTGLERNRANYFWA